MAQIVLKECANPAPVAFFAFNRPEHTARTLEALANNDLACKTVLHIFCDGPRSMEDEKKVEETRKICKKTKGFAEINIYEQNANQGLANSLIKGISTIFEVSEKLIVFEDDILASPKTLLFLNAFLDKYADYETIFNISAWSPDWHYISPSVDYPWDIYFIYRFDCWGWATWKNRWNKIDWNIPEAQNILANDYSKKMLGKGGKDIPQMIKSYLEGKLDTWAARAEFSRFLQGKIGINPVHSYICNIGQDGSGIHCEKNSENNMAYTVENLSVMTKLQIPDYIQADETIAQKHSRIIDNGHMILEKMDCRQKDNENLEDLCARLQDKCLELANKLASYENSQFIQSLIQLKDIIRRKSWREFILWIYNTGKQTVKKLWKKVY